MYICMFTLYLHGCVFHYIEEIEHALSVIFSCRPMCPMWFVMLGLCYSGVGYIQFHNIQFQVFQPPSPILSDQMASFSVICCCQRRLLVHGLPMGVPYVQVQHPRQARSQISSDKCQSAVLSSGRTKRMSKMLGYLWQRSTTQLCDCAECRMEERQEGTTTQQ